MRSASSVSVLVACLSVAAGCVSISPPGQSSVAPGSQSPATIAPQTQDPVTIPPLTFPPLSFPPITFPPVPLPTANPPGANTVVLVVQNGADQGTYTASGDPNCSHGVIEEDVWAAQFGNILAAPNELSSVQLMDEPDSSDKTGKSRIVSVYLTVGPVFAGQSYTLQGDRFNSDDFTYEINDQGTTAIIHFAGKTLETPLGPGGVGIDLTLSCPSVSRG